VGRPGSREVIPALTGGGREREMAEILNTEKIEAWLSHVEDRRLLLLKFIPLDKYEQLVTSIFGLLDAIPRLISRVKELEEEKETRSFKLLPYYAVYLTDEEKLAVNPVAVFFFERQVKTWAQANYPGRYKIETFGLAP